MSLVDQYRKSFNENKWSCWAITLTFDQCFKQGKDMKLHDKLSHSASVLKMSREDVKGFSKMNPDNSETFFILTNNIRIIDMLRDSDNDFFPVESQIPDGDFKAFYNIP